MRVKPYTALLLSLVEQLFETRISSPIFLFPARCELWAHWWQWRFLPLPLCISNPPSLMVSITRVGNRKRVPKIVMTEQNLGVKQVHPQEDIQRKSWPFCVAWKCLFEEWFHSPGLGLTPGRRWCTCMLDRWWQGPWCVGSGDATDTVKGGLDPFQQSPQSRHCLVRLASGPPEVI